MPEAPCPRQLLSQALIALATNLAGMKRWGHGRVALILMTLPHFQ